VNCPGRAALWAESDEGDGLVRRVQDYRNNARECRDLARKMPVALREQLIGMAEQWERLAEEREAQLTASELIPQEDRTFSASFNPE